MNEEFKRILEKKNFGLSFIILGIISLITGICFFPLAIINDKFTFLCLESVLLYIFLAAGLVFLLLGTIFLIIYKNKLRTYKNNEK